MEVVGYVLDVDENGRWTAILTESERNVLVVPSSTVETRSICVSKGDIVRHTPRHPVIAIANTDAMVAAYPDG